MYYIKKFGFKSNLELTKSLYSYDSDFDAPESEEHQDDVNFDKEDYLKWKKDHENDEDDE